MAGGKCLGWPRVVRSAVRQHFAYGDYNGGFQPCVEGVLKKL